MSFATFLKILADVDVLSSSYKSSSLIVFSSHISFAFSLRRLDNANLLAFCSSVSPLLLLQHLCFCLTEEDFLGVVADVLPATSCDVHPLQPWAQPPLPLPLPLVISSICCDCSLESHSTVQILSESVL